jgi:hypothetical protein
MSAKRERSINLLASGTFWLGMGIILTAPIMNLAYVRLVNARLSGDGAERMPEVLAALYNLGGQMGVTYLLSAIGVAVIIFGNLPLRPRRRSSVTSYPLGNSVPQALRDESAAAPEQPTTASGHQALQTRKYFS